MKKKNAIIQKNKNVQKFEESDDIPFAIIEEVPIYPGCEGQDNDARKKCMSAKIKTFITENFDTDLASDLFGIQKINISFNLLSSSTVICLKF